MKYWLGSLLFSLMAMPLAAETTNQAVSIKVEQPNTLANTEAVSITQYEDLILPDDVMPEIVPTEDFASRSVFRKFQLSPNGENLLMTVIVEGESRVVIADPTTKKLIKNYGTSEEHSIDWVRWAGNDKVLMSVSFPTSFYGIPLRGNRLFVRNIVTDEGFMIEVNHKTIRGGELVHLADDGSFALISARKSNFSDPAVYRYPLVPGAEPERVVKPKNGVRSWHADENGVVRLGMGWRRKRLRVYYRADEASKFKLVGKLKADDESSRYWSVVQIVSGSDRGYVLEEGENGRVGVRLFDYATAETIETFYENPDWDVEELWLKDDGTPLAAFYTDDREQIVWFDEEQEKLHSDLVDALQMEELRIISRSAKNERMMIWAGSASDPGALYVFTPEKRTLDVFTNYRPKVDFKQLVKPQPIRYLARDGLAISSYLTLPRGREAKKLPLIILPHGGPYGVRDKLEYNDEVQVLANRGYAVLQPNFRGSGGYGDAFFEKGTGQIGRKMQDDLDDAMDWAVAKGIADPARVCVVGGSYGGYAALWAVLRNPERYRCAASWAGVTDLDSILKYDRKYLGRKAGKAWRERVEGTEEFDVDTVSPLARAATLSRPVLLAHGKRDQVVPFSQYEKFEKATRDAPVPPTTLEIEDEGHSFSKAENEQAWYDALVKFLEEHNPADTFDIQSDKPANLTVD